MCRKAAHPSILFYNFLFTISLLFIYLNILYILNIGISVIKLLVIRDIYVMVSNQETILLLLFKF